MPEWSKFELAYRNGEHAALIGDPKKDNPYDPNSNAAEWQHWNDGWEDVAYDTKQRRNK